MRPRSWHHCIYMKILIADKFSKAHLDRLRALHCDIAYDPAVKAESLPSLIAPYQILVVRGKQVTADTLNAGAELSLVLRAGVLGARLPHLQAAMLAIRPGDLLVFATDGIRADSQTELTAETALPAGTALQPLADRILRRYATGRDDALALVVRYVGSGP